MNKIGKLEIIDTRTLIVPPKETAWLTLVAKGWAVKLNIVFEPLAAEQGVRIEPQTDHARIVFSKWDNSLGSATIIPVELGTHSNGEKLYFMATHYLIGNNPSQATVKFDIQFLMGRAA
ncbi:DUF6864 domain-containing function [Azonexus sp.]|uniref:DUF6864 domain-containing function n=1 Tax=Azonexus sp. TaxID=1872668 RepID=UPI0035B421C0